ncbi:MAG: universal stress protein [Haloglomus sp.]
MYDTVLVPTDGSAGARGAIEEACDLAAMADASVHGLYVVDTRDYSALPESTWVTLEEDLEAAGDAALATVDEVAAERDVEAVTTLRHGVPHAEILDYAEDVEADVVVMGTHGRSGLDRVLLGSVAEKVIRSTEVPVHVVRLEAP